MTAVISPSLTLCWRELVRFLRQRHRVIGALATPIVFWLLIGAGMGKSFAGPGASTSTGAGGGYMHYFFPGTILMILLFTAIFSTISVIEDRREGFLQSVLVAPVGRLSIVLGKVLGGSILATGQALLFLLLGWATGIAHLNAITLLTTIGLMFVISVGLTALGLAIAWKLASTQGFHAIMNLLLMPMWFLSGALFPVRDDMPMILKAVMLANPLSYGLASLRRIMLWNEPELTQHLPAFGMSTIICVVSSIAMLGITIWIASSRSRADLSV